MRLLQESGCYVIPSYDYAGEGQDKPPRLQGPRRAYPIPDLDVSKNGERFWVEVKTKASATYTRLTGRYEHGIPLRLFQAYLRVQRITGCPVWLYIVEEDTNTVLRARLDALMSQARVYTGDRMSRGGMVFWPLDAFEPVRARSVSASHG